MSEIPRIKPGPCRYSLLLLVLLGAAEVRAAEPYQDQVVPFLNAYCVQCHNAKTRRGELDLTRFPTVAKVVEDFRQWELVLAFLKKEEMPPAKAKQPPAALRAEVLAALERVLLKEARKLAGDPGACAAPAYQRGIRQHHPRSDRRGHPAGAGVPGGPRRGRGLQQHR